MRYLLQRSEEIGTIAVLEALDGEYGLEDPQIQLLRLTQYLMEGLVLSDRLASVPSFGREEEVNGIRFH